MIQGVPVSLFRIITSIAARRSVLRNVDDYSLTYDGLVITAERRCSQGWQLSGSYTLSRTIGLQPSSGTTAAGAHVSTVSPPQFTTFGSHRTSARRAERAERYRRREPGVGATGQRDLRSADGVHRSAARDDRGAREPGPVATDRCRMSPRYGLSAKTDDGHVGVFADPIEDDVTSVPRQVERADRGRVPQSRQPARPLRREVH